MSIVSMRMMTQMEVSKTQLKARQSKTQVTAEEYREAETQQSKCNALKVRGFLRRRMGLRPRDHLG